METAIIRNSSNLISEIEEHTRVYRRKIRKTMTNIQYTLRSAKEGFFSRKDLDDYYDRNKFVFEFSKSVFDNSEVSQSLERYYKKFEYTILEHFERSEIGEKSVMMQQNLSQFTTIAKDYYAVVANHKFIAASSQDMIIRLWQANNFQKYSKLTGHTHHNIILLINEETLYSSSTGENCIRVWNLINCNQLQIISFKATWMILRNNKVWIGSKQPTAYYIMTPDKPEDKSIITIKNESDDIDISEDGYFLALLSGSIISIWKFENFTKHKELNFKQNMSMVRFISQVLIAGIEKTRIRIWDMQIEREIKMIPFDCVEINYLWLLKDTMHIAINYSIKNSKNCMEIWYAPTLTQVRRRNNISNCASIPGSNYIVALADDFLTIWDINKNESNIVDYNSKSKITSVASYNNYVVMGTNSGSCIIYSIGNNIQENIENNIQENIFNIHDSSVSSIILKDNLVVSCSGTTIIAWNVQKGIKDFAIKCKSDVYFICLTQNAQYLLWNYESTINIFSLSEKKIIHVIEIGAAILNIGIYSDDVIFASRVDGIVEIWKFPQTKIHNVKNSCKAVILGIKFSEAFMVYYSSGEVFTCNYNGDLTNIPGYLARSDNESVDKSITLELQSIINKPNIFLEMPPEILNDGESIAAIYCNIDTHENILFIYNLITRNQLEILMNIGWMSTCFSISENKFMAIVSGHVRIYNSYQGNLISKINLDIQSFDYCGESALYGCLDGRVYLFNLRSNMISPCFNDEIDGSKYHNLPVVKVKFYSNYAISGVENEVRVWEFSERKLCNTIKSKKDLNSESKKIFVLKEFEFLFKKQNKLEVFDLRYR